MLLDWLEHPETIRGARMIETAVATVLSDPANATSDIGGKLGTTEMTARIIVAVDAKFVGGVPSPRSDIPAG